VVKGANVSSRTVFEIDESDIERLDLCPVCSGEKYCALSRVCCKNILFLETRFCNHCGLVYRGIRPKIEWFIKSWRYRDRLQVDGRCRYRPSMVVEKNRSERYEILKVFLENIITGRSLIDIGTGTGYGLASFLDGSWDVTGVEADSSRSRIGKQKFGLEIFECTIEGLACADKKYDIATMVHSLEHFHDPKGIIKLLKSFLKNSGYIYVEVPELLNSDKCWQDSLHLAHMCNFSEYNLLLLGSEAGLIPIYRTYPKSSDFGAKNLGVLFQLSNAGSQMNIEKHGNKVINKEYDDVLTLYLKGLPKICHTPVEYVVHEINDMSVLFKLTEVIHSQYKFLRSERIPVYSPTDKKVYLVFPGRFVRAKLVIKNALASLVVILRRMLQRYDTEFHNMIYHKFPQ